MSLINEALKRTRDASFQSSPSRPSTTDSYRISSDAKHPALGSHTGALGTILVIVIAAAVVLVFAVRVFKPGEQVREALIASTKEASPAPPLRVQSSARPLVIPNAVVAKPVEEPAPAVEPPPAAPPAPEVPKFVLQGITSAATWREAMINGYTVREGDDVDGARVVSIETRQVKLQIGDREILLRMH